MARKKRKPTKRKQTSQFKQSYWIIGAAVLALVVFGVIALRPSTTPETATTAPPVSDSAADSAALAPLPREISVQETYAKYQEGAIVVDVREDYEWEEAHAPNTVHIPLGELAERVNELPQDQEIVVICRSGNRSQSGRDILLNAGFTAVSSSSGGLIAWQAEGYPVVSGP